MRKINFLIAENQPLALKGIIQTLEESNFASLILEAKTGEQAVSLACTNPIDLVIMNYSLPNLNGFEAAKQILIKKKPIKILAFSHFDELPIILNFFKIGVKGIITKLENVHEIMDAIRTILNGDIYYNSQFNFYIDEWLHDNTAYTIPTIHFSKREIQMVTLISKGFTANEIAKDMGVSVRTIETYRYDLIKKAKVSNTSELIGYSYRNGLI
jgi:DNA-binding NarL/FixJ family response regulator